MKKKIQGTRSNFFHFSTSNQVCMPVFFQLDISFDPQFKQKNVEKARIYYLFCFLACSGGFLWERAPKLMDYLIFWAYWTKNQSHCPIRFDELFSYSLTNEGMLIKMSKMITILSHWLNSSSLSCSYFLTNEATDTRLVLN